ncbi:MAG: glycosyltransferase [Candidatus Omnitrophica bacterium]|nr:glycosyltransferase [Candidatus Omnitrophota bacterium]
MAKNLLIITQKVDEKDDLLGFFVDWIREFSKRFDEVDVITLAKGYYNLPSNVHIFSLGKEKDSPRPIRIFYFYKYLFQLVPKSSGIFAHMSPIFVIAAWPIAFIFDRKIILWYLHRSVTLRLKIAEKLSHKIVTAAKESLRIKSKKIIETGHGINIDKFKTERNWGPKDWLDVLSVGRISKIKNYEILIKAARILKNEGLNFKIRIIGRPIMPQDNAYFDYLKKLCREFEVSDMIEFIGFVPYDKIAEYFKQADVLVNMAPAGGLDKVVLEAMAAGCLILTSNNIFKKYLGEHADNLIFPDIDSLAIKLRDLYFLSGPKKLEISNFLEKLVKKDHDLSKLITNISALFDPKRKILITGFSYVDKDYIKTFDYYPPGDVLNFLVPEKWSIKKGKQIFIPPQKDNIRTTKAFFNHSNYPIIGGLLKGWMPIFPWVVFEQRPQIIYSGTEPNLLTALYEGLFAKISGAKYIVFTWENVPYRQKFRGLRGAIQRTIIRLNLLLCDGIVCGNIKAQQIINSLTNKPTTVLPLAGLDPDFLKPDRSRKLFRGIDLSDNIVFSFVGAIGYRKGIHLILYALKDLLKNFPKSRLIIAGNGEYEKEIDSLTKELSLADFIIRIPWLDREGVREVLNNSDVFLYPSIPYKGWEEQFGYSMAEASLMELPVIATNAGSMTEVILDGKTGILVEPDNPIALKEAMAILANNKEKRISMGRTGRQFIQDTYSHEVVALKFYKFFNVIWKYSANR